MSRSSAISCASIICATERHGRPRWIPLGPKAQAVLAPFLDRTDDSPCFSPREVRRVARTRYDRHSYCQAVRRACARAGVPAFTPYSLRHMFAEVADAELGLDAAQHAMGHSNPQTTRRYAKLSLASAAKVARPGIMIGSWALPPVIMYGTREQQERWIPPTLRGEITWCQLFSEPGAGSDLASLSTRAEKVEGGWVINGQKVWTSMAQRADWGILLARSDPDAPKHDGISCFMVDMRTPGIDIRPLRELTGQAMFNEVFFDDVFVPEDCLVGREHDGWRAARTTLANERVYMGSGNTIGGGVVGVLKAIEAGGLADDRLVLAEAGELVATGHALSALGFRLTLAALGPARKETVGG